MLTNIFSPTECAACKLCCNFHRSSAWETPSLETSLAEKLAAAGVPLETRPDGSCSFRLAFQKESRDEVCNCPMLDTGKGCTLPREERPFECRVWPLRLMRTSEKALAIGLYKGCPALTPPVLEKLKEYAMGDLLPVLLQYAERNPLAVRPEDPSYSMIWHE